MLAGLPKHTHSHESWCGVLFGKPPLERVVDTCQPSHLNLLSREGQTRYCFVRSMSYPSYLTVL